MKRLMMIVSVVVGLNLVAGIGGLGYLASRGWFAKDRLKAALAALRADADAASSATSQPTSQPAEVPGGEPTVARAADLPRDAVREELDRREREIGDQWSLLRDAQLQLLRDREAFAAQKKEVEAAMRNRESNRGDGYKRQIDYLSAIRPKQAKEFLRQVKDADAVEILLALDPRVGRKIIDACKTPEERAWMGRLLDQLRQRNDRQAEVLASGA